MNREAIDYQQSVFLRIKDFCKPLNDYLGISYFAYFKVYPKDSLYITFSNDAEYTKEYCSQIYNETMYFQQYLENTEKYKVILWPKDPFNLATDLIFKRGYWHGLNIVTHMDDNVMEGFDFVAHKDNFRINEFYIKHYDVLKKFIESFKTAFSDEITKAELCKARYKNGFIHNLPEYKVEHTPNITSFLQAIGINDNSINIGNKCIHFTSREKQCLEFMQLGYPSKMIAKELLVAPKTIETYIHNIKQKTGYHYKYDLIKMYRDFF